MKKGLIGAGALLALAFLLAGPAQAQTASADPNIVVRGQRAVKHPHKWVRAESTHFVVYSDAARPNVEAFVARMERFWLMLRVFSHVETDLPPDTPKEVLYYLADEVALGQIDPQAPNYAIGLYTSCADAQTGFGVHMYYQDNKDQALEKRPENEGLSYIYQAYARDFFHRRAMSGAPLWFVEGYAQYFSTTRFDGNEVVLGMAPNALAILLRRLGAGYMYSLDYADVLVGNDSRGYNQAGAAGLGNEFEARSWVLTHWILSNKDNLSHFQAYIKLVAGGEDRVKAFKTAFGLTPGGLNHVLWVYVRKLEAIKFQVKSGPGPDPDIAVAQMPLSAERLLMVDAALKTCPSEARGQALLKTARDEAARYPGDAYAQTVLARAEADFGDTTRALTLLDGLVAAAPHDAALQALRGKALLRAGQAKDAVTAFDTAGGLSPQSPDIAYGFSLAEAQSTGGFDTDAANAAVLAYLYAPQVEAYAWRAGLAYAWLGKSDEAATALHLVADNPHPSPLAPQAKAWLGKIAIASKADLSAAASAPLPVAPKVAVTAREDWTYASADVLNALDLAVAEQNAGVDINDDPNFGKNPN
jgi:tetratricopeptide (TPR) repeat protein